MYKMSIKSVFIWFIVAILGIVSSNAINFPNTTVSKDSKCKDSKCVSIKKCPKALSLLKEGEENFRRCGFNGNDPEVCCPLNESTIIFSNENEETATKKPSKTYPTIVISNETEVSTMIPKLYSDPFPSRKVCGEYVTVDSRITGGTISELYEFPWLARIQYASPFEPGIKYYGCAASLITNQHLITAAHCIKNKEKQLVSVRLGEWDEESAVDCRYSICNDEPVDRNITKTFIYESFNIKNLATGDIALIKLDEPVNFTRFIAPVCLPNTEYVTQQDYIQGSSYWAAGWGITEFGLASPIKRKVDLNAVHSNICQNLYPRIPKEYFETLICAGGVAEKDTCGGDSGGSLVKLVSEDNEKNWYLFGITSFGKECGKGVPGLYTRITSYMKWIREKIKQ